MKKYYLIISIIILSTVSYFYLSINSNTTKNLNIYSTRKEKFLSEIIEKFYQDTGIKINLLVDKAPKLLAKLENEKKHTPADILLTSDIINIETAKSKNLLQIITDEKTLISVPPEYKDNQNYWIGISQRARLIFYNHNLIDGSKIKYYSDLAKPEYKNSILIRSSSNPYNQALISSLIHNYGLEESKIFIKNIVNNFARDPQGGDTDQLKALAKGIGKIAIANNYYYQRILHSKDPILKNYAKNISVIYPEQNRNGYHVNLSNIAITKYSKNHQAALQFIQFILSKEIQKYFVEQNYESSVNTDLHNIDKSYKADTNIFNHLYKNANNAINIADQIKWK